MVVVVVVMVGGKVVVVVVVVVSGTGISAGSVTGTIVVVVGIGADKTVGLEARTSITKHKGKKTYLDIRL
jgi:hypothetical protein